MKIEATINRTGTTLQAAILKAPPGSGGGSGGFVDGNLTFTEHIVTVTEGNNVANFGELIEYFASIISEVKVTEYAPIVGFSLVGIANTYNQAICGAVGSYGTQNYGFSWRYRDGYQQLGKDVWLSPRNWAAILVPGTQYKVYTIERFE